MAQRDSGYERITADRYFTPVWVAELLKKKLAWDGWEEQGPVVDLCAGAGHLLLPFAQAGAEVSGYDIIPDASLGFSFPRRDTLLKPLPDKSADLVIMNPPYGEKGALAIRFIDAGLKVGKRLAVLLPVDFDSAKTRRRLFVDCPHFTMKLTLTRRIRWANIVQKDSSPSSNHAWFFWDTEAHGVNRPIELDYD